jgi:hypothetical protein
MKFIKLLLLFFTLSSCLNTEVKEIDIPVFRFDKQFHSITELNYNEILGELESEFPQLVDYFISDVMYIPLSNDSIKRSNIILFNDNSDVIDFNKEINKSYPDVKEISDKLNPAFGRFLFHFPDAVIPEKTVFLNSYNTTAINSFDNNLVVGLEFYLLDKNSFINDVYEYQKARYDRKYMIADALEFWLSSSFWNSNEINNFQDELIFKGKIMYLIHQFIPEEELDVVFRFSKEDLMWCTVSEHNIWNEIMELELMYSEDVEKYYSFFNSAPFTRGMPKESPGRIGNWVGYQIVDRYMNNTDVSLQSLMSNNNSQEILLKSKYRP